MKDTIKIIDLLNKIENGELKEHTFFRRDGIYHSVSGNEVSKYEYIGNNDFMVWFKDKNKKPETYNILRLGLNAEIEIIEEIEEAQEIELLKLESDNKGQSYYIVNECGTKCFLTKHSKMIVEQQNEIAKAVNYLLKQKQEK